MNKIKNKELVPMKAVKCPICEGGGTIISKVINAPVKCRGCAGKGWVEVHMAEPVPAPKIKQIPQQPDVPTSIPQYPWGGTTQIGGWGGSSITWKDIASSGSGGTSIATTSNWTCDLCGTKVSAGNYHTCSGLPHNTAYTVQQDGTANWVSSNNQLISSLGASSQV